MTDKHSTPEETDEPIDVDPLTFEQIVKSLLAMAPSEDGNYAANRRAAD